MKQYFRMYKKHPKAVALRILVTTAAALTVLVLFSLVFYILIKGIPNLKPSLFEWKYTSKNASMMPAIINTITMVLMTLLIAVPFGIGSAIYLTEYAKRGNKVVPVIRMTTETLSGIPSIVYGLFGYMAFVRWLDWGYSLMAGIITLAIMILPLIMRTTEEALLAVPDSYREGSYGLGAGRLRTIFRVVLPSAMPGILSGVILGVGRIVGDCRPDLHRRFGNRCARFADEQRTHPGSAHVCAALRRPLHRRSLCHRSGAAGAGIHHQPAQRLCGKQNSEQVTI